MAGRETKEKLLQIGAEILHRKGFNDTGIQEVLKAAGVPKGSFYYHFSNKEEFGLQVIEIYATTMLQTLRNSMKKIPDSILDGLKDFFRNMTKHAVVHDFSGCPLGNLAQEMGDVNEVFRNRLNDIFYELEKEISGHLDYAMNAGQIRDNIEPDKAAMFLVSGWEGALLRMKLTKNTQPFDVFLDKALGALE